MGQAIQPAHSTLQLGDIVCFSAPLTSERGGTGSWQGEGSVVVDSKLGVGSTSSVGQGTVSFMVSDDIMTETEVSFTLLHPQHKMCGCGLCWI